MLTRGDSRWRSLERARRPSARSRKWGRAVALKYSRTAVWNKNSTGRYLQGCNENSPLHIRPVPVDGAVFERKRPVSGGRVSAANLRAGEPGGSRPYHARCRQQGARGRCPIGGLLPQQSNSTRWRRGTGNELAGASGSSGWSLRRSSLAYRQHRSPTSVRSRARRRPSIRRRAVRTMKALFADISERSRQRLKDAEAWRSDERRQLHALCDAVQIALANGEHDRVNLLLEEMRTIVDAALARRNGFPVRISA
jgi:hypothetical protein